jgi:hypothetical protein
MHTLLELLTHKTEPVALLPMIFELRRQLFEAIRMVGIGGDLLDHVVHLPFYFTHQLTSFRE